MNAIISSIVNNSQRILRRSRRTAAYVALILLAAGLSIGSSTTSAAPLAQVPGANLAFASDATGRFQIWKVNTGNVAAPTQLTFSGSGSQESRYPDWSNQDKIAFQFGATQVRGIHMMDSDGGNRVRLTFDPEGIPNAFSDEINPSWSPDGQFIAYSLLIGGDFDIWIHRVGDPTTTADDEDFAFFGLANSQENRPAWSPDPANPQIAFVTTANGGDGEIMVADVLPDPNNPNRVIAGPGTFLTDNSFIDFDPTWSPDANDIAFSSTRTGGRDIYRMNAQFGEGDPQNLVRLTTSGAADRNPAWSPDGNQMAFVSERDGDREIFIMSAVGGEQASLTQITTNTVTDDDPVWEPVVPVVPPSLNISVFTPSVVSGVPWVNGSGTVRVTDQFGQPLKGATITILGPQGAKFDQLGNLRYGDLKTFPDRGNTDANGEFTFVTMEPTQIPFDTSVEFSFIAVAQVNGQPITAITNETLLVLGSGAAIPPNPLTVRPISPQARIPLGGSPWTPQQKADFAQNGLHNVEAGIKGLYYIDFPLALLPLPHWFLPVDILLGWKSVFQILAGRTMLKLAQDPPDPNFDSPAFPVLPALPPPAIPSADLPASVADLFNESVSNKAVIEAYFNALQTSVDRYITALGAGDFESAALQRNAILAYGDTLRDMLEKDADLTEALLAEIQANGLPNVSLTEADVIVIQAELNANGFPTEIIDLLQDLNLSSSDIQELENQFLNASPADVAGDLFGTLQNDADASREAGSSFNEAPIADAGPDQTVDLFVGLAPVTLDGSGSVDPEGDNLTYTWSGPFPEGGGVVTGVNPTVSLPLGVHTISLNVDDGFGGMGSDDLVVTVIQQFTLTVAGAGGGNGSVTDTTINCDITAGAASGTCTDTVNTGSSILLTATADLGSVFGGWTNCDTPAGNQCTMTVDADKTVTATFDVQQFTLTVDGAGGGSGAVTDGTINCSITGGVTSGICSDTVNTSSSIVLTATEDAGSVFGGWTNCDSPLGNQCAMIVNADKTVTATFDLVPSVACPGDVLISNYQVSPSNDQFVEVANVGTSPISVGGCSLVTFNVFTETSIGAATVGLSGILNPGEAMRVNFTGAMPAGPAGIGLYDVTPPPPDGAPFSTQDEITGMVYLDDNTVFGISHLMVPAHNAIYDCIYGGSGQGPFIGPFPVGANCLP